MQDVHENKVQRGLASGIYNAAGDLGNILGPSIGAVIAQATSISGVFVIASLGSTVLFLFVVWAVRFVIPASWRFRRRTDQPKAEASESRNLGNTKESWTTALRRAHDMLSR